MHFCSKAKVIGITMNFLLQKLTWIWPKPPTPTIISFKLSPKWPHVFSAQLPAGWHLAQLTPTCPMNSLINSSLISFIEKGASKADGSTLAKLFNKKKKKGKLRIESCISQVTCEWRPWTTGWIRLFSLGCGGEKHRLNTENVNETGGACTGVHKDQFSAQSRRGWRDTEGQSLHANNNTEWWSGEFTNPLIHSAHESNLRTRFKKEMNRT